MKKIVTIMLVMLVSIASSTVSLKDKYHFIIEGSFIADKNISYTIYQDNGKGEFVSIEYSKAIKIYHIELNAGGKYLVRFQNKKGNVKFLMIDASTYGYFQADVDWTQPYDGLIKKEKIGYCLVILTNGNRPTLLAQK